jgi:hypothetical protein
MTCHSYKMISHQLDIIVGVRSRSSIEWLTHQYLLAWAARETLPMHN